MNPPNVELKLLTGLDDALDFREWLGQRRDWLGFDLETTGLNKGRDRIRTFQAGDTTQAWTIPWDDWSGLVKETMNRYDRRMVGHNVGFDWAFLERDGVHLPSHLVHCTQIMTHMNNPLMPTALKSTTRRLLGPWAVAGQAALSAAMAKQGWTWATVPIAFPAYWAYGALDTTLTAMLAEKLWPRIQNERLIYDIEMGAIRVMRDAELTGVMIDMAYVADKTAEMQRVMHETRPHIPEEIKNPGSDAQVEAYLQRMGARLWRKTDKGNYSMSDEALKEFTDLPGVEEIRKWRRARWLENNYWKNMRELNVNGVLRPSIKPVGARTSRMSITQPALQTIPRGDEVRNAFVAREGHSLITCDYDQLEFRIMAYDAQEEAMLEGIRAGKDFHDDTADKLYGEGAWVKEQRQVAKNANFAKGYVAGVETFARTAGVDRATAEHFMQVYDQAFPRIQQWQDRIIMEAQQNGYVTTLWGRKIPVNKNEEYKGVNWRIQATATSDLIKLKIIEADAAGVGEFFRLPIHDELMFEAPDDIIEDVAHTVGDVMTEEMLFPGCPLTAEPTIMKRWMGK